MPLYYYNKCIWRVVVKLTAKIPEIIVEKRNNIGTMLYILEGMLKFEVPIIVYKSTKNNVSALVHVIFSPVW